MPSLPPPDLIPQDGLHEVLRGWSGRGLLAIVAALERSEQKFARDWKSADAVSRARRILLSRLAEEQEGNAGLIARLPSYLNSWLELIPAAALRHRRTDTAPFCGVEWVTTRRLHGWPPSAFSGRVRHRVSDDALLAPAVWVLDALVSLSDYQGSLPPHVAREIVLPMRAATELLQHETVRQLMPGQRPNRDNFTMLSSEGAPWSAIAEIGQILTAVEDDPYSMATMVLFPDEGIAWRLFHLACLGEVLLALSKQGLRVASQRPLAGDSKGPAYTATGNGVVIDVWFEAAGAWNHYGVTSPYRTAAPSDGKPLGADIFLRTQDGARALIIECKYYLNNPQNISRDGYLQALAYAAEAHGRLASRVSAIAVGPHRLLPWKGHAQTSVGSIYVCSHAYLQSLLLEFLRR